jgi:hypothetical protein
MFVTISGSSTPSVAFADYLSPGRDHDYQTLNIAFATNVVKSGMIIRMFPKPLKPCAVLSICVPLPLNTL